MSVWSNRNEFLIVMPEVVKLIPIFVAKIILYITPNAHVLNL